MSTAAMSTVHLPLALLSTDSSIKALPALHSPSSNRQCLLSHLCVRRQIKRYTHLALCSCHMPICGKSYALHKGCAASLRRNSCGAQSCTHVLRPILLSGAAQTHGSRQQCCVPVAADWFGAGSAADCGRPSAVGLWQSERSFQEHSLPGCYQPLTAEHPCRAGGRQSARAEGQ